MVLPQRRGMDYRTQRQILSGRCNHPRDSSRLADGTQLDRFKPADRSASAFASKLSLQSALRSSGSLKTDERRQAIKRKREKLIQDLERMYVAAFDRPAKLEVAVGEIKTAQLIPMMLNSKQAAIEPLGKEINKTVITTPGQA